MEKQTKEQKSPQKNTKANFRMEWIILESGSTGNASVLRWQGRALLVDGGIAPSRLHSALRRHRIDPNEVSGLIVSHIHADHCHVGLVRDILFRDLPVFAHESHFGDLAARAGLTTYLRKKLVPLKIGQVNRLFPGWEALSHPIPHGDMINQAFVFELDHGLFEPGLRLGYMTDLGVWDEAIARFAANCDLLGLEFNHDETMQLRSGRPWFLIQRNLGDGGHLSNTQAGQCLARIRELSQSRPLKGVVQLHLSRSCNKIQLARKAVRALKASPASGSTLTDRVPRLWTCEPGTASLRIAWSAKLARPRELRTAPNIRLANTPLASNPSPNAKRASAQGTQKKTLPEMPLGKFSKDDLFDFREQTD